MYQIGERVVYGIHGVCRIVDLQIQKINRKSVEYYVLQPETQSGSCFFVPAHNQAALSKLRPVLSKEKIMELLSSVDGKEDFWTDDENERKQRYRQIIVDGSCDALLGMIRALHIHRREQLTSGKKFHVSDANFLKDAEKIVYSEFSVVLGIPYEQVEDYINQF